MASGGMNNNNNANNLAAGFEREVVYMECRRNHAASLGKVSCVDGCCEFLGGGRNDDDDDDSVRDDMLCASCNCHRNCHRQYTILTPIHPQPPPPPPPPAAGSSQVPGAVVLDQMAPRRKRKKRTVFTAEQKNRMRRFAAERLGWKPKKEDKEEIERFCLEMGISRRVFLVWVTNNRRKALNSNSTAAHK